MATYVEEGEQMVINGDIPGTGNKPVEREMGVNILKKERKKTRGYHNKPIEQQTLASIRTYQQTLIDSDIPTRR